MKSAPWYWLRWKLREKTLAARWYGPVESRRLEPRTREGVTPTQDPRVGKEGKA